MKNKSVSDTRTMEMVTIPRAEYEHLKAQNEWLLEQLRVIRNKQFGFSSEKASEEVYEQLSLLFDEAEVYTAEPEGALAVEVRSHTRKQKSSRVRDILPVIHAHGSISFQFSSVTVAGGGPYPPMSLKRLRRWQRPQGRPWETFWHGQFQRQWSGTDYQGIAEGGKAYGITNRKGAVHVCGCSHMGRG